MQETEFDLNMKRGIDFDFQPKEHPQITQIFNYKNLIPLIVFQEPSQALCN